jgi:hypothetical protein
VEWGLVIALALSAEPARFPKGLAPMKLPPPAAGLKSWSDAECAGCHRAEGQEHALSGHAVARSSFVFQAGAKDERPQWCVGCHAPLASSFETREPSSTAPEEAGIGCAACHAGTRGVLSSAASPSAPHAIEATPALRDGTLCANCHGFGFLLTHEDAAQTLSHRPQQDTVNEWLQWKRLTGAATTCWSCHARDSSGHALSGHRNAAALREAVSVERKGDVLEVRTAGVGHALPTGDVMRWISIEFSRDGFFSGEPAAHFGLTLGTRRWPGEDGPRLGIVEDTRLQPHQAREVPIPSGAVAWQLVYHLVSEQQEQRGNLSPALSRLVLSSGALTAMEAKR